ncbi:hypothetical protein BH18ACI3_BH18ACI3_20070 [soil metagenome]
MKLMHVYGWTFGVGWLPPATPFVTATAPAFIDVLDVL